MSRAPVPITTPTAGGMPAETAGEGARMEGPAPAHKGRTMAKGIYVSATTPGSGKSLVALGLADTLHRHADRIGFFKPVVHGPDAADDPMAGAQPLDPDRLLQARAVRLRSSPSERTLCQPHLDGGVSPLGQAG